MKEFREGEDHKRAERQITKYWALTIRRDLRRVLTENQYDGKLVLVPVTRVDPG